MSRLDRSEIVQEIMKGRNCAQCTLGAFEDETGYDLEETEKICNAFGGGMLMGQTCGAVTGALMAIGMITDSHEEAEEMAFKFENAFRKKYGSTMCRDLIKIDLSVPGNKEKATESGVLLDVCPTLIDGAIKILDEIINE